jgi:hypothetical protein
MVGWHQSAQGLGRLASAFPLSLRRWASAVPVTDATCLACRTPAADGHTVGLTLAHRDVEVEMGQTRRSVPAVDDDRVVENYRQIGADIVRAAEMMWGPDGIITRALPTSR